MCVRGIPLAVIGVLLAGGPAMGAKFAGEAFSLGAGARGLALGGAVVAGPFDGTAPYWNPAGMNRLHGRSLTAMHAETFGSLLNHDFVSYVDARADSLAPVQAFGFYLYYLGGGGIKITSLDEVNRPTVVREVSHGDWLLSAAVSGRIARRIDIGVTGKIIYRDLGTESGVGLSLDVGALYDLHRFVRLGLMVTDITTGFIRYSGGSALVDSTGRTFTSAGRTESILPAVKPGLMLHYTSGDWTGRLMAAGDIRFENLRAAAQYWSGALSLDTHYGLEVGWRDMLFGRAGFDIGRLTAGAGVAVRRLSVDFAYLHQGDLDETYRVSAGFRF